MAAPKLSENTGSHQIPSVRTAVTLLGCLGLFLAFGWQTISLLSDVYQGSADYSHGFVVPVVSLYAAYEIRKGSFSESYAPSWLGLLVALAGAATVILGIWYRYALLPGGLGVQAVTGLGLYVTLIGLCFSLGGTLFIKRYLFPLGYMAFAVPWPESLTSMVTVPLRSIVTDVSVNIIRSLGIAVFQEGNIMHLANATLGVADACSGIRSLWIMLATAVAFGYFLRCGFGRSLALFLLAIPMSMFFNILRVVATGLLVAWSGPQWSIGTRHELTGAVVFLLGVIALVAIGWFLAQGRVSSPGDNSSSDKQPVRLKAEPTGAGNRYPLLATLATMLILGAVTQSVIERHYVQVTPTGTRQPFSAFPNTIGQFREAGKGTFEATQIDLLRPTDMLNRTFRSPRGNTVSVWSLYWEPYRGKKSAWNLGPHSPDGCYPSAGWQKVPLGGPEILTGIIPGKQAKVRVFSKDGHHKLLIYVTSDTVAAGDLAAFPGTAASRIRQMVTSWKSPDVQWGAQYVVTIESDVTTSLEAAMSDVQLLLKELAPLLPAYGIL